MNDTKKKTKFDLLSIAEYEKTAEISYFQTSDGTQIRYLQSKVKKDRNNKYTLVLIAGWASIVLGWDDVLTEAQSYFDIVYIETREKGTSIITKKSKFDIERFTLDIKELFEYLKLDQNRVIIITSSFSSMLVAYMLKNKMISPFLSVFIGPIERIPLPRSLKIVLAILPNWLYTLAKPVGIWWVRHFKAEDEEHAAKYTQAIKEGDPYKWKQSSKYFSNRYFWVVYTGFEDKVLVIDESVDRMHDTKITQQIKEMISNCEYIDLETNKNTHSKPIIDTIRKYIEK